MGRSLLDKVGSGAVTGLKVAGGALATLILLLTLGCNPKRTPPTVYLQAGQNGKKQQLFVKETASFPFGSFNKKVTGYEISIIYDPTGEQIKDIKSSNPITAIIPVTRNGWYVVQATADGNNGTQGYAEARAKVFVNFPPVGKLITYEDPDHPGNLWIDFSGTDPNGADDIANYLVNIFNHADGSLVDKISQASAIKKDVPVPDGDYDVKGIVTDKEGATGNSESDDIPVTGNPKPPKYIISASFSATQTSGDSPLELKLSVDGTETGGGTITRFALWDDLNNNGKVDSGELIDVQKKPITNLDVILLNTGEGDYTLGAVCYDDVNGVYGISATKLHVNPQPDNPDLKGTVTLNGPYYEKGKFPFSVRVDNETSSQIELDNSAASNYSAIRFLIMHALAQGVYQPLFDENFKEDIKIKMNPQGWLKMLQTANPDESSTTIKDAYITYPPLGLNNFYISGPLTQPNGDTPAYVFPVGGTWRLGFFGTYNINGQTKEKKIVSEPIAVGSQQ